MHSPREPEAATPLRRRVRAALRRAARRRGDLGAEEVDWRQLFEQALDPVLVYPLSEDGRPLPYRHVNDAALRLYGYSREEMLRMSSLDLVDPASMDVPAMVRALRERSDLMVQSLHVARDGRRIPVEVHAHYFEHAGHPTVLAICRDLTARREAEAAARAQERRLTEVLESIGDSFLALDHAWRITHVNRRAAASVRKEPADLIGKSLFEEYPGYSGTELERAARQAVETGEPVLLETYSPVTERWVEGGFYPTPEGLSIFGRDVSVRKRAEQKLARSTERLRALAEAALAITQATSFERRLQVITDEARRVIGAHQAVTSLTEGGDHAQSINAVSLSEKYAAYRGYDRQPDGSGIYAEVTRTNRPMRLTQAEMEAHPAFRHFGAHAAEHPPLRGWMAAPLIGHAGQNLGLIQLSDKEGGEFDEDDEAVLIQFAQFASSAIETARAKREQLREAERFRVIVNQALVGVAQTDLSGRFTYVNDQFCAIVGYRPEELTGRPMQELTHPDDLPRNLPQFHETAGGGAPFVIEKRYVRKDGSTVWVNNTVRSLLDPEGKPFAILAVVLDVTERRRQEQALRESEARFRFLAEAMPQKVFTTDPAGVTTYLNDEWAAFAGLAREEIVEHGWARLIHPDEVEENVRAWERSLESGEPFEFEHRFRRADGEWHWHISRAVPMRDGEGRVTMWVGSSTEVQDLKATQQRLGFLLELDRATQGLEDPAEVMAVAAELLGEHLGASRCAYAQVEADEDHFTITGDYTRGTFSIVGRFAMSDFGAEVLRLMRANETYVTHHAEADPRLAPRDLEAYRATEIASVVCVPLHKGGRFVAAMAVHQRVPRTWTPEEIELVEVVVSRCWESLERARAAQALRESETRFRTMSDAAPVLIWLAGPTKDRIWLNRRWLEFTGRPMEQEHGSGWVEGVHPDDLDYCLGVYTEAFDRREPFRMEYRLRRHDGAYRWLFDEATPLYAPDGTFTGYIGAGVDIHDRIEAQGQLEELNATLEQRVSERTALAEEQAHQIRRLAAEVTRAEQQERRRLATTLHDHLQQLLAAAQFHLQLASGGAAAEGPLRKIGELLNESLAVSRSLTVQLSPPVLHDRGLGPGLQWLGRWMEKQHGLRVALELDATAEPEDEHVRVVLFEAAREVLFNVVKHAGVREASLRMDVKKEDVCLTIQDKGVGFAPSPPHSGAALPGLGLPTVRERLGYVGGTFDLQSHPGQGTRVTLAAPLAAAPLRPVLPFMAADAPPSPAGGPSSPPLAPPLRVLLVDDHEILRAGLHSLLQAEDGIEVVGEAADGVEAVDLALTLNPDVIVMDITMPRMNGIEATRRITDALPEVRVVGLSMHSQADMAEALREAGAATYVAKGGPPHALVEAIRGAA